MADLETAELLACTIVTGVWDGMRENMSPAEQYAAALSKVEARDAAVRLALLDEMARAVETSKWLNLNQRKESGWGGAYADVMRVLRAKYTRTP